ncbi:MAG TPA: GMP/IMP nucleotidase [Gammaproteobacteria bacterium]|nr:GMP/IMP nucleotidase [Gammaproteobacteria bacterium]
MRVEADMIAWEQIRTVLLDMDGTLLDLRFDNYFWNEYLPDRWGSRRGLDPAAARTELLARIARCVGTLDWYCIDFWSRELGVDVMALKADIDHMIVYRPHAEEFLHRLFASGRQVVMVTNAHRKLLALKIERTGIDRYFHHIVSSHDYGAPKEIPAFWERLEAEFRFERANTLLIDDNLAVLRMARDYGIGHLLTIAEPDSGVTGRDTGEFAAIDSFLRVLP